MTSQHKGHRPVAEDRGKAAGGHGTGHKPPGQRQLRVGEELRHALAQVLARAEIRDPGLAGVSVTVTEVRVSPDLKNATAFVLPLGGRNEAAVMAGLARCAPYLRGQLAHMVPLRYSPRLNFKADDSFEQASRIEALLRRPDVAADLVRDGDADGGAADTPAAKPGRDDDGA